jgi:hypothetical protein
MTTADTTITKANIVEQFKTIRDTYNAGIVWHTGNNPFTPSSNGGNNYGGNVSPLGGNASGYATGSIENNISDSDIVASTIVTQFRDYAKALSRIRRVRLLKYYNTNGSQSLTYDQTNITNLNSNYQALMDVNVSNVTAGETISASNLDTFVSNLSTAINTNRTTTVTLIEYYCHSSCHSSCHGSI